MRLIKVKPGVPRVMDATDNPTFQGWMHRIDRLITAWAGLSVHDLPDCPFREWYEDRLRPIRAANLALRRAGGDGLE